MVSSPEYDIDDFESLKHRSNWSPEEKNAYKKLSKSSESNYRKSMGEKLDSPNPGILWSWTDPSGKKTSASLDIWKSDSGFFFPNEPAQKKSRQNIMDIDTGGRPNLVEFGDVLVEGNPILRDRVVRCNLCQRESYVNYPKHQYDEKGFVTEQITEDEMICRDCMDKRIIKPRSREYLKKYGDDFAGYKWDVLSLHGLMNSVETTPLSEDRRKLYKKAIKGKVFREEPGKSPFSSEKVSRFLQGIFDF